jgi:hypothetical protein
MAYEHAPLGPRAVEHGIRQYTEAYGVELITVTIHVTDNNSRYHVAIAHRDKCDDPGKTLQHTCFVVHNYRSTPIETWEYALLDIKRRQDGMPAHLSGREVNVTEDEYREIMRMVDEATGFKTQLGDFAVWKCDGSLHFTGISRPGGLAFHRYIEVKKIPLAEPVYDIGDPGKPIFVHGRAP